MLGKVTKFQEVTVQEIFIKKHKGGLIKVTL